MPFTLLLTRKNKQVKLSAAEDFYNSWGKKEYLSKTKRKVDFAVRRKIRAFADRCRIIESFKQPVFRESQSSTACVGSYILCTTHVTRPSCFVIEGSKVLFPPVQIRHDTQNFRIFLHRKHGFLQRLYQKKAVTK